MIIEEIKSIKSGKRELRQFGITIGIVLGLLGLLFLWREKEWFSYLLIVSIVFLFFGLALPALLKPIHKIWMTLALLIGWLVTGVIIIVLFYLVVTPIGLLARLFGKDFLDTKIDRDVNSYWIPRKSIKFDKRNYENQF
jgi:hypothetical protein